MGVGLKRSKFEVLVCTCAVYCIAFGRSFESDVSIEVTGRAILHISALKAV